MELKFYDKVKVTKGFYEGLEGNVVERTCFPRIKNCHYFVKGYSTVGMVCQEWSDWICETSLEKLEE